MNLVSTIDENIKKQHPAKSHEQNVFSLIIIIPFSTNS